MLAKGFSPPAWGWSGRRHAHSPAIGVLPTRVGMVRSPCARRSPAHGSPHPRGDGPQLLAIATDGRRFSPPAWGWSVGGEGAHRSELVLPTRVGMVRSRRRRRSRARCSPHPRGDGPRNESGTPWSRAFSPPAWGWSDERRQAVQAQGVLPTRVGMVQPPASYCPPRRPFSPPAWGWSGALQGGHVGEGVLPTRVGMVRNGPARKRSYRSSPHPRGDGPCAEKSCRRGAAFSPPAWGWSGPCRRDTGARLVLPTRVGMVRGAGWRASARGGSPHPRGDGPLTVWSQARTSRFSPPAWGWSVAD